MDSHEQEIAALGRRYAEQPTGSVVFYGSSSIRLWPGLGREFPGVVIENWGFGGSTLRECAHYFARAIVPRRPRGFVFFAGENDLALGSAPDAVWETLCDLLDARDVLLPGTPFAFGALKPSPARAALCAAIEQTNDWCARELAARPACEWLDFFTPMLDAATGWGRPDLFMADQMHLSRAGYEVWNGVLRRELSWLG